MADGKAPFWRTKKMSEMTKAEWESLCDGCGRCCLNKLTDEDTNQTVYTDVGCKLLDVCEPAGQGEGLHPAHAPQCRAARLAAADLRLSPCRRGA